MLLLKTQVVTMCILLSSCKCFPYNVCFIAIFQFTSSNVQAKKISPHKTQRLMCVTGGRHLRNVLWPQDFVMVRIMERLWWLHLITLHLKCYFRFLSQRYHGCQSIHLSPHILCLHSMGWWECLEVSDVVSKTEVLKGFGQKDQAPTSETASAIDEDTILKVLESHPVSWFKC